MERGYRADRSDWRSEVTIFRGCLAPIAIGKVASQIAGVVENASDLDQSYPSLAIEKKMARCSDATTAHAASAEF